MLHEYEKEAALQAYKIEQAMNELASPNSCNCMARDTTLAAAYVAHTYLFSKRFGAIESDCMTMVFANMGPSNIDDVCTLHEIVKEAGVQVRSLAVWPLPQLDEPYTWALLIEDDDHQRWLDEAIMLHANRPRTSDGEL